jgi:hypothetical protein
MRDHICLKKKRFRTGRRYFGFSGLERVLFDLQL